MSESTVELEPGKPSNAVDNEAAKYRRKYRDVKAENEGLKTRVADLEIERDDALNKLKSAPDEAAAKIAELQGVIRHRTHRDAFDKLAAGKIRPEALDDAFALSGWKVESDDIDENTMGELIGHLVENKPYLRADQAQSEPAASGESAPAVRSYSLTANRPVPAKGAGRGPAPEVKNTHSKPVYRL